MVNRFAYYNICLIVLIINPIKDSMCESMFQDMTTIKIIHYHISQLLDSWLVDWLHEV